MKELIRKKILLLCLASFVFMTMNATHNRAGEITYVQLSDLTYEITITTFTYTKSFAIRTELNVEWGDNSTSVAPRISTLELPNYYQKNIYKITHTFPGPGIYKIVVQDPNRNLGVKNIPNSVNVVFSISTILTVNPAMGRNNTPVLLNPPYDKAAYGYVFIHNPAAFDPDGDSLSYKLTVCTREDAKPIPGYTLPPATHFIRVDSISGDLIWDSPADTGIFNVAMNIEEWRDGKKIGVVERDMQIEVFNTKNKPPVNGPLFNYCTEVGDTIDFLLTSTDENNDQMTLHATSGVFAIPSCSATFTKIDSTAGFASSRFRWIPCHEAVRSQPYNVIFKSDDDNGDVNLSDIDNISIKVLGPSPTLPNAVPVGKQITLSWSDYGTPAIAGFAIYRREGATNFVPDSCTAGLPASTGFVKVGYIAGSSTTSFSDSDNGKGLQFGKEYTYRIVAVYPNGAESKASNEITSTLVSGVPVIKIVSVTATSTSNGSIYIEWRKPDKLDTIPANGPYEYIISRATGIGGSNYEQIRSIKTASLNDTTFTDVSINTQTTGYIYKIELWNDETGNRFLVGEPAYASSVYLSIAPGDRKAKFNITRNVPWINTRYDFFRFNDNTSAYDSVGTTNQLDFIDKGLENGKEYCYYIRSVGGYLSNDMPKNLVSLSESICITPVDNEPPCPPGINVNTQCDSLYNTVRWSVTDDECNADIAGFRLFYKLTTEENLSLLAEIDDRNIFSYKHFPGDIIAGCYAVSAYDSVGNESEKSVMMCIDSCNFFEIPNVFTPNGDDINEKLVAKTSGLVEKIDFRLFNRNGMELFKTENPRIEWDGTYKGKIVSPGVYFYQCDVYERRISGLELFHLSGFVHVITEVNSKLKNETTK
ncbi:MAG: gliding motility-associated C-terminal domain-containing protein [Bacteroidales bacterium]|nr:gliding motility-associated C-terminal domain-containing protein [Bacteroidales bacterium]